MIKYYDIIEEEQTRVGNTEVVWMRIRNALRPPTHAVSEKPDRAPEKRRQLLFVVDAQRAQLLVEQADRIGRAAIESQTAPRIESNEGEAADVFPALDALEKERFGRRAGKRGKCSDGRERIGTQLPNDGNDIV